MLTFSDFMKVYEAYTTYAKTQPTVQPTAQPTVQLTAQSTAQPTAQPSNADLMAAIGALQTPIVNAQTPQPESIDDVICRIAGIQIPKEDKKGAK